MSWFQQLVGKLKSVFGRKSAQGEAATEEKPAEAPSVATEEPAEAPVVEEATPAAEPASATEEPAAEPEVADEPVATPAATSEVTPAEADVPAPETPATTAVADEVAPAEVEAPAPEAPAVADEVAEPATDAAPATAEPAVEEPAPAEPAREAHNPAISTLDVEGITAELQAEGPYGPGSAKPGADGSAPSAEFTVKGKASSKLFHTEKSPYFSRTKADVWFKSEADAESAGFQAWDHKKRTAAKK